MCIREQYSAVDFTSSILPVPMIWTTVIFSFGASAFLYRYLNAGIPSFPFAISSLFSIKSLSLHHSLLGTGILGSTLFVLKANGGSPLLIEKRDMFCS